MSATHIENSNWRLISAVPRFVAKDFDVAATFYGKLGFKVDYRDEGFMILSRDSVEMHMNLDTKMERGKTVCYIRLTGIDSLHKNAMANEFACHPLVMKEYGQKEFWLNDPFMNIIIFAQSIPEDKS